MSPTSTQTRRSSQRLSVTDPAQALTIARKIREPWFRCQALSQVARYWPHRDYVRLLDEAVDAADSQHDVYKRVTVSAWPIRAYIERNNPSPAGGLLKENKCLAENIDNLGSRSEALLMLLHAARPFAIELWEPVFWALVDGAEPSRAWRQRRNLSLAIQLVAADHPKLVQAAIDRLSDERTISAIKGDVENRRFIQPRPFFWID